LKIERVLAPNPGPFTSTGTNTWIIDGDGAVAIIDPGPLDRVHERAIVARLGERPVAAVVVTHTHEDHAPLANPLAEALGVPAYGFGPGPGFDPDETLADGSRVAVGTVDLEVVHTPGHAEDHLCFLADRVLFTGDHIMGGSSVMVEDMIGYLRSLERVKRLRATKFYPGHGDIIEDPAGIIDWYVAHRLERERQVLAAVRVGASTVPEVVEIVYREVDPSLHPLAARSVGAHLRKLEAEGAVRLSADTVVPAGGDVP
jgi:glyoxylase-like metal-dependent hydrolase (beta-lactamase superfamily II)